MCYSRRRLKVQHRGTREIAAILVADIVGYSHLAGADEDRTLSRLRGLRSDLIDSAISAHDGRIVKSTGRSRSHRVSQHRLRRTLRRRSTKWHSRAQCGLPPERRIDFRIGVHFGDVAEEADGDLMGDGVNVAARLEGVCEPGGVCLSEQAYSLVKGGAMSRRAISARSNSRTLLIRFGRLAANRSPARGRPRPPGAKQAASPEVGRRRDRRGDRDGPRLATMVDPKA